MANHAVPVNGIKLRQHPVIPGKEGEVVFDAFAP